MTYDEFAEEWLAPNDYVNARTSGSTGTPKSIHLLKSDMRASACATNAFFGITSDSVLVCPLSADYIAGKMMAVRAWESNSRFFPLSPSATPDFIECDLLAIVPAQCCHMLSYSPELFGSIIVGGAQLSSDLRHRLASGGYNAYESYGMTETCSHVALRHVSEKFFQAMPGVTFSVDNRGCLVIDIAHMSIKRVTTNDIVRLVSDTLFEWLGRADFVINSGAIKLHPEQIEMKLREALDTDVSFYVTGETDARWGSRPVIITESPECVDALMSAALAIEDKIMRPDRIYTVEALEWGNNNKIRRLPLQAFAIRSVSPISRIC